MRPGDRDPRGERGATAVVVALVLIAIIGMLSLAVDGGFLFVKFRAMRTANDAAALAAALSCAMGDGQAAADFQADLLAVDNVADASRLVNPVYDPSCASPSGTVTVRYRGYQELFFSQVVGVSSPKQVAAAATASWGGAGASTEVVPLMLSVGRLSSCDIPYGAIDGESCFFWWDNGTQNDQTALTNAEWGLMDLDMWGVDRYASCPGNVNQADVTDWIRTGYPGTLTLLDSPPTYVCRGSGFQGGALNQDINFIAGQIVPFPVNDPMQQVQSDGSWCRPDLVDGPCTVQKYAIIGFGMLEIVWVWTGQDAQLKCNHPAQNNGSIRCLEAKWRRFVSGGSIPKGGANFGLVAVNLVG